MAPADAAADDDEAAAVGDVATTPPGCTGAAASSHAVAELVVGCAPGAAGGVGTSSGSGLANESGKEKDGGELTGTVDGSLSTLGVGGGSADAGAVSMAGRESSMTSSQTRAAAAAEAMALGGDTGVAGVSEGQKRWRRS